MGKYSDFKRNDRDFYPTPYEAVLPLIKHLQQNTLGNEIIRFSEPFAGDGSLIRHLGNSNLPLECTHASDILPLKDSVTHIAAKTKLLYAEGIDMTSVQIKKENFFDLNLDFESMPVDIFITNTPWDNSKKSGFFRETVIYKMMKYKPTWVLLSANYLFNKNMWISHRLENNLGIMNYCKCVVPVGRVKWEKYSKHSGKQDAAWFLFDDLIGDLQVSHPDAASVKISLECEGLL